MKYNVQDVKAGDEVFLFNHSKYPQVVKVVRVTKDFVFINRMNYITNQPTEEKYRRDGSSIWKFSKDRLVTIEDGDVAKFEQEKKNNTRIGEIVILLDSKGFRFNGHTQWYDIDQWEKLASAFTVTT